MRYIRKGTTITLKQFFHLDDDVISGVSNQLNAILTKEQVKMEEFGEDVKFETNELKPVGLKSGKVNIESNKFYIGDDKLPAIEGFSVVNSKMNKFWYNIFNARLLKIYYIQLHLKENQKFQITL